MNFRFAVVLGLVFTEAGCSGVDNPRLCTAQSPCDGGSGGATFALGVVDGLGNDRARGLDGGSNDDVVMGKVNLSP